MKRCGRCGGNVLGERFTDTVTGRGTRFVCIACGEAAEEYDSKIDREREANRRMFSRRQQARSLRVRLEAGR